jgi:hypothetical protein
MVVDRGHQWQSEMILHGLEIPRKYLLGFIKLAFKVTQISGGVGGRPSILKNKLSM